MSAKRYDHEGIVVHVDDDFPAQSQSAVLIGVSTPGKYMTADEAYDLGRALVFAALEAKQHQAGQIDDGDPEWVPLSCEIRNPRFGPNGDL